jgi:hypothetical protein
VTLGDLLSRVVFALEAAAIPYMVTGSIASSAHGLPRSTRDLDVVIRPTSEALIALIQLFPESEYYADVEQALHAFESGSQFNVIDFATGWKVDFIIAEQSEYGRASFARRRRIDIAGVPVFVTSAEDVILNKLKWAKLGSSGQQVQDAAGIFSNQGKSLDFEYIEHWVAELHLGEQWRQATQR